MLSNRFCCYVSNSVKKLCVLRRKMCTLPHSLEDRERVRFFENLFGCSWSSLTKFPNSTQLFELDTDRLQNAFNACIKVGIDKMEMRQYLDVLAILPTTIEQHALLLEECGFKRADAHSLTNYLPLIGKRISLVKAHGLIPNDVDPAENILSYLEPEVPGIPRAVDFTTTLHQAKMATLRHYLSWRLETNLEQIDKVLKTYQRIKHKSFRLMRRNLDFLEENIGFTKEKIRKHGYLIHCSHENTVNTLKLVPTMGGLPTADILRKHPKIFMTATETILQTMKHLQDFDISDEAILKCPEIFTLASSSVLRRLQNLRKVPEFGALLGHPRVLRLVHYQPKAEGRLGQLKELQVKCASLHVLAASGTTFDKYAREGADKTKGTDIAGYLEKNLGYSDTVIRMTLSRHPYWCHIPLISVHETLDFLLAEGFTKKQVFDSIHVLLYPKAKVEAELRALPSQPELSPQRLTPLCRGWVFPAAASQSYSALAEGSGQSSSDSSSSESDDDRWLTGESRSAPRDHRLDFVVYFIERDHHFTGDGIWPPSTEADSFAHDAAPHAIQV